jgi:hypothetical protein
VRTRTRVANCATKPALRSPEVIYSKRLAQSNCLVVFKVNVTRRKCLLPSSVNLFNIERRPADLTCSTSPRIQSFPTVGQPLLSGASSRSPATRQRTSHGGEKSADISVQPRGDHLLTRSLNSCQPDDTLIHFHNSRPSGGGASYVEPNHLPLSASATPKAPRNEFNSRRRSTCGILFFSGPGCSRGGTIEPKMNARIGST